MIIMIIASVLVKETHILRWDFDIKKDPLISDRRPVLTITNNNNRKFAKLWTLLSRLIIE